MCEMCSQHGEGRKWFLRARNYSDELMNDPHRRAYVQGFFAGQRRLIGRPEPMRLLGYLPSPIKSVVVSFVERNLRANHYGQVVTLDEARLILSMMGTIVRLPCVCRRITLRGEHRHCLGFSLIPGALPAAADRVPPGYWDGPSGDGLERLTKEQALSLLGEYDCMGLVHSVWTLGTPYIGGLCNCDHDGCRAIIGTLDYGVRVLHPGESAAVSGPECSGCRACLARCQFMAIEYDSALRRVRIDPGRCFGCGLCLASCPKNALELKPRDHRNFADRPSFNSLGG